MKDHWYMINHKNSKATVKRGTVTALMPINKPCEAAEGAGAATADPFTENGATGGAENT
jgi:hypothetical protein